MEGRRVSRKSQKYNPLFILFMCLIAAVIILLVVTVVLGARLGKANKALKESEAKVNELNLTVSQLEDDLTAARSRAPSGSSDSSAPSAGDGPATEDSSSPANSSWLDLSGHSEVKVQPKTLLDGYSTYYTTAGVNLRGGPATSYDRITTVDYGTKVEVAAREGNWSFAKVGNRFGWLSSDYLSTTQPEAQTSTSSSTSRTSSTGTPTRSEATAGSLRR